MKLVCVDPAKVHLFWPRVRGLFVAAVDRCGDVSIGEIELDIDRGHALLWLAADGQEIAAAAATRLVENHRGKHCEVTACGGRDMKQWIGFIREIEKFANNEGCRAVRIYGRKGWSRLLGDYKEPWVALEKTLDQNHAR